MRFIRLPDRLAVPAFGVSPCQDTFNLAMRNAILTRIFYTSAPRLAGNFTITVVQMDLSLIVERYQLRLRPNYGVPLVHWSVQKMHNGRGTFKISVD